MFKNTWDFNLRVKTTRKTIKNELNDSKGSIAKILDQRPLPSGY